MRRAFSKGTTVALLALLLLASVSCVALPQGGSASNWGPAVKNIEDTLNKAVAAYERGDQGTANQLAKDAYFDVFESSGLETAIRLSISAQRAFEVEYGFTEVNQALRSGARPAEVRLRVADLMAMIRQDAARLEQGPEGGTTSSFLASFFIIVREGFEAILVIGALIAYLVKSGNKDKVRTIYLSATLAIVASVATAVALRYLFSISGASQEFLEGATMLLAVAVLFSVSFWLLGKVQAQRWQHYIQSKLERSLTTGSTLALGSVAFLAVYREGAETVLFYQALISGSPEGGMGAIALGFAVGSLVLAGIFAAIRWGSVRIPIKPFFVATGALLYYMAFMFAGEGARELQEAGALSATRAPWLPSIEVLGVYPTWEGLALQTGLLLAAGLGLAYQFLYKAKASSTREKSSASPAGIASGKRDNKNGG